MNMLEATGIVTVILLVLLGVLLISDAIHKRMANKTLKFMLIVFITGVACSFFPFFTYGFMFGLPSVILNAIMLTIIFRNKL